MTQDDIERAELISQLLEKFKLAGSPPKSEIRKHIEKVLKYQEIAQKELDIDHDIRSGYQEAAQAHKAQIALQTSLDTQLIRNVFDADNEKIREDIETLEDEDRPYATLAKRLQISANAAKNYGNVPDDIKEKIERLTNA